MAVDEIVQFLSPDTCSARVDLLKGNTQIAVLTTERLVALKKWVKYFFCFSTVFSACVLLHTKSPKRVLLKLEQPTLLCVYDSSLLIYLEPPAVVAFFKGRNSLTRQESELIHRIRENVIDTIKIKNPGNSLNMQEEDHVAIFVCMCELLAKGKAGVFDRRTSKFARSVRVYHARSDYIGHQRIFKVDHETLLTQVFSLGE